MRARWPLIVLQVVSELTERTSVLEKRCEVLKPDVVLATVEVSLVPI